MVVLRVSSYTGLNKQKYEWMWVRGCGYLAEVGVEVNHAVAELLHVLCQQLVCVGYPVVQVAHLVVRVAPVEAPVSV